MNDYVVRVVDAARELGLTVRMAQKLIRAGTLDAKRAQGGRRPYLISRRSLDEELRRRRTPAEELGELE